jgi:hypothetical protein
VSDDRLDNPMATVPEPTRIKKCPARRTTTITRSENLNPEDTERKSEQRFELSSVSSDLVEVQQANKAYRAATREYWWEKMQPSYWTGTRVVGPILVD